MSLFDLEAKIGVSLEKDVLTKDNFLHVVLGIVIAGLFIAYVPLGVFSVLYIREVAQAKSWLLGGSMHKLLEAVLPSLVFLGLWELGTWLLGVEVLRIVQL